MSFSLVVVVVIDKVRRHTGSFLGNNPIHTLEKGVLGTSNLEQGRLNK
jgi:hypothetical protein